MKGGGDHDRTPFSPSLTLRATLANYTPIQQVDLLMLLLESKEAELTRAKARQSQVAFDSSWSRNGRSVALANNGTTLSPAREDFSPRSKQGTMDGTSLDQLVITPSRPPSWSWRSSAVMSTRETSPSFQSIFPSVDPPTPGPFLMEQGVNETLAGGPLSEKKFQTLPSKAVSPTRPSKSNVNHASPSPDTKAQLAAQFKERFITMKRQLDAAHGEIGRLKGQLEATRVNAAVLEHSSTPSPAPAQLLDSVSCTKSELNSLVFLHSFCLRLGKYARLDFPFDPTPPTSMLPRSLYLQSTMDYQAFSDYALDWIEKNHPIIGSANIQTSRPLLTLPDQVNSPTPIEGPSINNESTVVEGNEQPSVFDEFQTYVSQSRMVHEEIHGMLGSMGVASAKETSSVTQVVNTHQSIGNETGFIDQSISEQEDVKEKTEQSQRWNALVAKMSARMD